VKRKELSKLQIFIEALTFECIIGILDFERTTPQKVIIDLRIDYNYDREFINYAEVAQLIEKTMQEEKFLLIEDALSFLSQKLKKNFLKIELLFLKITKPSIMPNCRVSVAQNYTFDS
jgi:dihydroneopterin aldolase